MISIQLHADPSDTFQAAVEELMVVWKGHRKKLSVYERVLNSDAALKEWAKSEWIKSPITRRSTYGKENISPNFTFEGFPHDDPREPVIMRGACIRLYRKYALSAYTDSPNGWCSDVLNRYLRRMKITCFDYDEYHKVAVKAYSKLCMKHGANGRGWDEKIPHSNDNFGYSCWINGKFKNQLTKHQLFYIKKLWRISQGIEQIELKNQTVNLP